MRPGGGVMVAEDLVVGSNYSHWGVLVKFLDGGKNLLQTDRPIEGPMGRSTDVPTETPYKDEWTYLQIILVHSC